MNKEHIVEVKDNTASILIQGTKMVVKDDGTMESRGGFVEGVMTIDLIKTIPPYILGMLIKDMVTKLEIQLKKT